MRDLMPLVTEFVDWCRDAFGVVEVNASIKAGISGRPMFYAEESGHVLGTQDTAVAFSVTGDALMESVTRGAVDKCR